MDQDPSEEEKRNYADAKEWVDMLDANQMNILMIGSLIKLLMAASMMRLIVNQKL